MFSALAATAAGLDGGYEIAPTDRADDGSGGMVYGVTYIGLHPVAAPIAMGPSTPTPTDGYTPGPASIRLAPPPVAHDATTPTGAVTVVATNSGGVSHDAPDAGSDSGVSSLWYLAAAVAVAVLLLHRR